MPYFYQKEKKKRKEITCPSLALGNLVLTASSSSFPSGAAPDMTILTDEMSYLATKGLLTMVRTMGGTKGPIVTLYFCISSRNGTMSNFCMMRMAAPTRNPHSKTEFKE